MRHVIVSTQALGAELERFAAAHGVALPSSPAAAGDDETGAAATGAAPRGAAGVRLLRRVFVEVFDDVAHPDGLSRNH